MKNGTNMQTAVEWLLNEMFNNNGLKREQGVSFIDTKLVEKAKEMEKEQLLKAEQKGFQEAINECAKKD